MLIFFCLSRSVITCWFSGPAFQKCLSEYQTDKTLVRLILQKQSHLGLRCLSRPLWRATSVCNFTVQFLAIIHYPQSEGLSTPYHATIQLVCYYTIDFNEVDIRIYLPEKVIMQKYVHEVLVDYLVKLAQESVVRLTDRLDMTIDVDRDIKHQNKQTCHQSSWFFSMLTLCMLGIFSCSCCRLLIFFLINFLQNILRNTVSVSKQFGSRSGPTFCRFWFGSKLFVKCSLIWVHTVCYKSCFKRTSRQPTAGDI